MTNPEELAWNHAIDNEDFHLADEISKKHLEAEATSLPEQLQVSNATKEQSSILGAAAYWGIDYGSLPNHEP